MQVRFVTCDVFTDTPFQGNPLAVIPDARGLSTAQMQAIAREFNYAESTFVLPPETPGGLAKVRIFTPVDEMPFAGHPTIGTALMLKAQEEVFGQKVGDAFVLEEKAGPVPVTISDGQATFTAPKPLTLGPPLPSAGIAASLNLSAHDLSHNHPPQVAGVGLDFVFVELASREALARARADATQLRALEDTWVGPGGSVAIYAYFKTESVVHARMFDPNGGIPEDPATGSAAAALAALLHKMQDLPSDGRFLVHQGEEMGRKSLLSLQVSGESASMQVRVSGGAVKVMSGELSLGGGR
ncbi:MAG: PhzF family phenazine biosynthesis protein [Pseudomonadota bacterium]